MATRTTQYAIVVNRTPHPVIAKYDGQEVRIPPYPGEKIIDTEMATWLFLTGHDAVRDSEGGIIARRLGLKEAPNEVLERLDPDCLDCDPIDIAADLGVIHGDDTRVVRVDAVTPAMRDKLRTPTGVKD